MMSTASSARIRKLLALSASAALIGSAHEAQAALNRAMIIAQDNGIEIAPLAAAAGVKLPKPAPLAARSRAVDTGRGYVLTSTVSADERLELCTIGRDGRVEIYFDDDGCGIRSFVGYMNEIDRDFWAQVQPLARVHSATHARYFGQR